MPTPIMKKFEYKIFPLAMMDKTQFESKLNELGLLGWELVYIGDQFFIMMRETT